MRPSMRLPLREALYVCSNCRAEVTPRGISPLARQFRRHASDSPSILDRARRSLWKGDKPPGPEDPYRGESQLMRGAPREEKSASSELAPGDEKAALKEGDEYVQAETWDGLPRIGFTPENEWLERGSSKADKYSRYGSDVKTRTIPAAARQAAVEISLMQMLGKPPASICDIAMHHSQIRNMIMKCVFDGPAAEQWNTALRFPDQTTMDALVFVFNQIGESTESKEIESPETFLAKQKADDSDESYRTLSFADPAVKFAFIKRFSQLIGRRVPDQIITSSTTVNDIFMKVGVNLKEKPVDVAKRLKRRKKSGKLPANVQFAPVRITRGAKDEELGRKKAIYAELFHRGLLESKKLGPKDTAV